MKGTEFRGAAGKVQPFEASDVERVVKVWGCYVNYALDGVDLGRTAYCQPAVVDKYPEPK